MGVANHVGNVVLVEEEAGFLLALITSHSLHLPSYSYFLALVFSL